MIRKIDARVSYGLGCLGLCLGLSACSTDIAVASADESVGTQRQAAVGDSLRQIHGAYSESCSINTGLAFDGTNLLVTCWYNNHIDVLSPADGSLVRTVVAASLSNIEAAAWDDGRSRLWACVNHRDVYLIDTSDGTSVYQFTGAGCTDGLAYDASDDSLWSSQDVASAVQHYDIHGTLLSSNSISGMIGACGNSGIAVGGADLFLANNGCSQIYRVKKDFTGSTLFAGFPARLEDLECDDITFADQGKGAIWSIDAYDRTINAWEIEPGLCRFGGGVPLNQAPVAQCQNRTVSADASCAAAASIDNGSYDPDGGPVTCVQSPSGPFGLGSTDVTLTCTDSGNENASCTGTVTVVDDSKPAIQCPADATVECTNVSAVVSFAAPTTSDNCSSPTVGCLPGSGSSFPLGTTVDTCTATDAAGNSSTCAFSVNVRDSLPPVVTSSGAAPIWPPNHSPKTITLADCGIQIVDQCQGNIDLATASAAITCVTSDEPLNSAGDGNTVSDISIVSPTAVNVLAERIGREDGRVYTIHFTTHDAAGNVSNGACKVCVPHDQGAGANCVDSGVKYSVGSCN